MDKSTVNVRSSINFLNNNDQEQREKIEIQLIPALQSFQSFIKMTNESQMAQIVDSLMAIDFFKKSCPEGSSLRDFIMHAGKALTYEYYKQGQIIFHYGDYGDKFFMILKGNVGVLVPKGNHDIEMDRDFLFETNKNEPWSYAWKGRKLQSTIDMELLLAQGEDPWVLSNRYFEGGVCLYQKIYTYYGGQTFGDVSLYTDKPRTASILVLSEDIHVITMNKSEYKQICEKSLQDMNNNVEYFMRMLPNNSKFVITKFMQYMHKIEFAPQSILWKEGEESKFFMLIFKGRVELIKKIGKVRITLCQLSDNSWVGQEEIFDQSIRQSTCQCADNTVAYYIQIDEFNQIRRNFPEICKILKERSHILKEYMKIRYEMIMNNFINKPKLIQKERQKVERKSITEIFHTSIKTKTQDIRSHSPKSLSIIEITEYNNKINQSRGGFRNLNIFPLDKDSVLSIRDRVCRQLTKQNKKKQRVQPQTMREGTLLSSTISDLFQQNDQVKQHSLYKQNDLKKNSFSFLNLFAQGQSNNIPTNNSDHFTSRLTTQQSYFRMKTEQGRSQIQTQTSFDQKNNSVELNKLRSNSPLNSIQFSDRHQNKRIHSFKMIARPKKYPQLLKYKLL
ncbi:unnamed protein product [Paramecium primaurelia]|uniref:Cyclic nucleotide-binding domain-containing protein n=1 Tax=Paramecium primaurelia TaxID=5886 RepID=A0A8S1LU37_PARPR|nr:unnamed protein product [Paramecium primaurelia]